MIAKRLRAGMPLVCLLALGLMLAWPVGQSPMAQQPPKKPIVVTAGRLSVVGAWSAVTPWEVTAIHATLLFNGKVLVSPRTLGADNKVLADVNGKNIINSRVWVPTKNAENEAKGTFIPTWPAYNIFCSGHCFLGNGHLFVAGGHIADSTGERKATIYDPDKNTWQLLPKMKEGRWYPSCVTLASGDVLVLGGLIEQGRSNPTPQVWQEKQHSWRDLTGAQVEAGFPFYPRMHLAPNGMVFMTGPKFKTQYLNTHGAGKWETVGERHHLKVRDYGSSVMYEPGKVLVAGGGFLPLSSAEVIDLNVKTPHWRGVDPMRHARRHQNATLLADGTVFVSGGTDCHFNYDDPNNKTKLFKLIPIENDAGSAVRATELWDPKTEHWTTMANQSETRIYHSTALLLPDARVLSAGGGEPWGAGEKNDHRNAQIFSPPYLFKGPRPAITHDAPHIVAYGANFDVKTPDAGLIRKVTWIRLGSATHACNFDQRFRYLQFQAHGSFLTVSAPSNPNLTPPGPYMLFLLNEKGVPSEAKIMRIN